MSNREYIKEIIIATLKEHLDDALFCTREWSAWSYGTMTEDDFVNINSEDNLDVLAEDLIKKIEEFENDFVEESEDIYWG